MAGLRTETRLIVLIGLVIGAFLCGLLLLYNSGEKRTALLVEDKMKERAEFLAEFVELHAEPLKTFAYDYSFWDEMVDFAGTGDSTWGYDNIFISLTTYKTDAAWVYGVNGDLTYCTAVPEEQIALRDSSLENIFGKALKQEPFQHFFIYDSLGLLEIRIAPIQPSSDNERVTAPKGFFIVGKIWDSEYIDQLERTVQAEIAIVDPTDGFPEISGSENRNPEDDFYFSRMLPGPDGQPVAKIACMAESPLYYHLQKTDYSRIIYIGIFSFGIMLILSISLHIWVSRPLRHIMNSLLKGEQISPEYLRNTGVEFKKIGGLVSDFFTQKAALESEIGERRMSEERLKSVESRYRIVSEQTGQMVYDWDIHDGNIVWAGAIERITGSLLEEYQKVNIDQWEQLIHPDDRQSAIESLQNASETDGKYIAEYRLRRKDGSYCYIEDNGVFLVDEHNKAYRMLGTMKDVTERRTAEEALKDRENLLKSTLESTADGILVVDNNGRATHWNARFQDLWNIPSGILESRDDEKMLDYVLSQLMDPEAFLEKVKALYQCSDVSFDNIGFTDGRVYERYSCPLMRDGVILGRVWSFRDITQRMKAEQSRLELQDRLERAQRMESLGLLAGGVAHDLNNMFGPVIGYAELLLNQLPPDSPITTRVAKIAKSAQDAAMVIQDLLTLARRGRYEMRPLDANAVIRSYLDSTNFEKLKERYPQVTIQVDLSSSIGLIMGSEIHLEKDIMNLVGNAFEAMPTGGILTIQTTQTYMEKLQAGYQNIDNGEYVIFRIKDTGVGISPDDIKKIFEPYFSRKKMGSSGSGLGLAVVYGIIKDHHGYYDVVSEIDKGTEFILYFPVSKEAVLPARDSSAKSTGGIESVLVVDDSSEQRELAAEIIGGLGYTVHTVENGRQAIDFVSRKPVDILLLDMIMEPDFDGLDTYQEILKIHPGQKALIVSGFSSTDRVQEMLKLGAGKYIRKPYNMDTLTRALREELDKKLSPATP
ncbi:MAG: response regulator [Candidatus Zixiibacteriota bacterium]